MMQDIVVTATKRAGADSVQKVPFAVTAFGAPQLQAQNFQNLETLSFSMPNVSLDANNGSPGFANFAIRGQGLGSTIPSLEGAVGVFVDGIFMGTNAGLVFDNFDLEAVEVVRGPQGVLFGKNVTGGAVLIRTTRPTNDLTANWRVQLESGLAVTADARVSGPIVKDKVAVKLAAYYNYDDGYFRNEFDGTSFGKQKTFLIRPAILFTPSESVELLLRYEHGSVTGDGAPAHNFLFGGIDSFRINIDNRGFSDVRWNQVTGELNVDVGLGDGRITNIAGYRDLFSSVEGDIDALPQFLFNSNQVVKSRQFSNELRYSGTFGPLKLTTGLFYFDARLFSIDNRALAGPLRLSGGGEQDQKTYGIFASVDWNITDKLILNLGGRYNYETKDVRISTVRVGGCSVSALSCNYTIADDSSWKSFTPKLGAQYFINSDTQLYAFYARGFRGGGYNFRNTNSLVPAGPFANEDADSYEIGMKADLAGGRIRLNAAAFLNKIAGLQRAVQTAVPSVGSTQVIVNTADATIKGFEGEASFNPVPGLVVSGNFGYLDGQYDAVLYDLSGNGIVGPEDKALKLIRLPSWTYGASVSYKLALGGAGDLTSRVSFNHRDANFATDNNAGKFPAVDQIDFNVSFKPTGSNLTFSVYGRNMLDEVSYGTLVPLTLGGPGSRFGDLKKGRVFGGSIRWSY